MECGYGGSSHSREYYCIYGNLLLRDIEKSRFSNLITTGFEPAGTKSIGVVIRPINHSSTLPAYVFNKHIGETNVP